MTLEQAHPGLAQAIQRAKDNGAAAASIDYRNNNKIKYNALTNTYPNAAQSIFKELAETAYALHWAQLGGEIRVVA
jgi:hypothetical protein